MRFNAPYLLKGLRSTSVSLTLASRFADARRHGLALSSTYFDAQLDDLRAAGAALFG